MPDASSARILIADDEAPQMKALCDTLRDHGYETVGASNGQAALAALRETKFDLLLTDLMMPEMDGIGLLRAALELDPNLVGIVMTGEGTITTAVEAMKQGALDYILKPFKLSFILPVLSRALTVRRLRLENVELERKARARAAELEAANKELEAFSYSASHDLRAPLRHIDGFSSLLLEDCAGQLKEEQVRHLHHIRDAAQKMGELIEALLKLSRVTRSEINRRPVDLSALAGEIIAELRLSEPGRTVTVEIARGLTADGDPHLLRVVLTNLLGNAWKYTSKRADARIEFGQTEQGVETAWFVRDNGAGFDMTNAAKLFGLFQRLHRPDEFEGTGIGLATVQRIVHRHSGHVWAESRADEGATFYFALPKTLRP